MKDPKLARYVTTYYRLLQPPYKAYGLYTLVTIIEDIAPISHHNIFLGFALPFLSGISNYFLIRKIYGCSAETLSNTSPVVMFGVISFLLYGLVGLLSLFLHLPPYLNIIPATCYLLWCWFRSQNRKFWWHYPILLFLSTVTLNLIAYGLHYPNIFDDEIIIIFGIVPLLGLPFDLWHIRRALPSIPRNSDPSLFQLLFPESDFVTGQLEIVTILACCFYADFRYLQRLLGLTLEDLIRLLSGLESAELIRIVPQKHNSLIAITETGQAWLKAQTVAV